MLTDIEMQTCRLCFSTQNRQINIFYDLESNLHVAEVINKHIGEVSAFDSLPKFVCIDCWTTTENFHKFHRSVKSAQSDFLERLVKHEPTNDIDESEAFGDECDMVKPLSFVEINQCDNVFVNRNQEIFTEALKYNVNFAVQSTRGNESVERPADVVDAMVKVENNGLNSLDGGIDISARRADFDYAHDLDDKKMQRFNDLKDTSGEASNEVNGNVIIAQNFDFLCDVCHIDLKSLKRAKIHYRSQHHIVDGYIKCCGLKLNRQRLIDDHVQWHINPDIFKCESCDMRLKTKAALCTHISRHNMLEILVCDLCGKTFKDKNKIKRHLFMHLRTFVCKLCSKRCPSQQSLEAHERFTHSSDIPARIQTQLDTLKKKDSTVLNALETEQLLSKHFDMTCDVCGDGLRSLQQAQFHYMHEHQQPDGYIKCCGIKFNKNENVKGHIDWHSDPESFKCIICGNLKNSTKSLRAHLRIHLAPPPDRRKWDCLECKQTYLRKDSLEKHMERSHGQVRSSKRSVRKSGVLFSNKLSDHFDMDCEVCGSTLDSLQHAKLHYLEEHGVTKGYIKCCDLKFKDHKEINEHLEYHRNPDIFKCNICAHNFLRKRDLNQHLLRHKTIENKRFTCAVCNKVLPTKSHLKIHRRIHEQARFSCPCCNKRFTTEKAKKSHEQSQHQKGESPMQNEICEFCAKSFSTRSSVLNHINKMHSDNASSRERFQCEVCNAYLGNRGTLKEHILRHFSEPQKCSQCDKVAPNPSALAMHIRNVHTKRIHNCHLCEKSFKAAVALKDHVATHTGEKLYKCSYCPESFIWRPNCYSHQKKCHPDEWSKNQKRKDTFAKL